LARDLKKSTRGVLCLQHTLHKSEVNFFFEWLQGKALAVLLRGGSCLICSYLVFFLSGGEQYPGTKPCTQRT
jgi:hypothetical protein